MANEQAVELEEAFDELEADVRVRETEGFDLSAAAPVADLEDEGQVVHIRDHVGNPLYYSENGHKKPVTMTVAGTYSKRYRQAETAAKDRRFKRGARGAEVFERETQRVLAACVLSWQGFFDRGKPIPCREEHVMTVLKKAPWIEEQVTLATHDHEGFSPSSSDN